MKYLKYWRLVKGLTQEQVAREAGISQGHYCDIEKRGKKPHPGNYQNLADAIGRPVEELISKLNGVSQSEMAGISSK